MSGSGITSGGDGAGAVPAPRSGPARVPGQSTIIASELGGDLPCLRCKYNLKGLSIRAVCPECGMPVKATLLAVVDPLASELRPIRRPLLTGLGVVVWATAALAAALCVWSERAIESFSPSMYRFQEALGVVIVVLTLASGLGAAAMIKPHDGLRRSRRRMALVGVLAYLPLALVMWWLHVDVSGFLGHRWDGARQIPAGLERSQLRLLADAILIVIIVALRPNARTLAARSLLMRTGRVDRQTMLALAGVLVAAMAGDGAVLASTLPALEGPPGDTAQLIGQVIVLVAGVLFTIGLVGVAVDCWRMRAVIVEAPVSLEGVLKGG